MPCAKKRGPLSCVVLPTVIPAELVPGFPSNVDTREVPSRGIARTLLPVSSITYITFVTVLIHMSCGPLRQVAFVEYAELSPPIQVAPPAFCFPNRCTVSPSAAWTGAFITNTRSMTTPVKDIAFGLSLCITTLHKLMIRIFYLFFFEITRPHFVYHVA